MNARVVALVALATAMLVVVVVVVVVGTASASAVCANYSSARPRARGSPPQRRFRLYVMNADGHSHVADRAWHQASWRVRDRGEMMTR
jgi:hypothetical protein